MAGARKHRLATLAQERGAGDAVETCTVLTTQANEAMKPIHHRMPVILPEEAFAPWLEGEDLSLDPCPPDAISVRPVSRWVNNAAHDLRVASNPQTALQELQAWRREFKYVS